MEEKARITLELTERQRKLLEYTLRLELICMDPYADIVTLEKKNILNMLHKEVSGRDCFDCDPESLKKAVNYHIDKLKESDKPDEEAIERLTQLLK